MIPATGPWGAACGWPTGCLRDYFVIRNGLRWRNAPSDWRIGDVLQHNMTFALTHSFQQYVLLLS